MNKARITYRFEQPEPRRNAAPRPGQETNQVIPLLAEEYNVVEEQVQATSVPAEPRREEEGVWERQPISSGLFEKRQPLNQFTTDFGSWSSPFDEETERVERAIRATGRATIQDEPLEPTQLAGTVPNLPIEADDTIVVNGETGYYQGPDDRMGYSAGPRIEEHERLTVHSSGSRFERHSRTPWMRIVLSVSGAIATGVFIGFIVLSMFSNDGKESDSLGTTTAGKNEGTSVSTAKPGSNANTAPGLASSNTDPNLKAGASTNPSVAASTSASATAAIHVPARTYTLLQVGAFANQQGADAAMADLRKLGFAAASQASDKVYLYAGLTPGRDEALALSAKLKAQKADVYIKSYAAPAVSSIKWNGKQPTAADTYFTQANKLTTSLTNVTTLHLKETTPGPLEDNTLQAIHTVHQAWSNTAAAMGEGLADGQKAVLQKMNAALNTAVVSMDEYKKNPSASYLWQAQNGVLQYVLLEIDLLQAISAG